MDLYFFHLIFLPISVSGLVFFLHYFDSETPELIRRGLRYLVNKLPDNKEIVKYDNYDNVLSFMKAGQKNQSVSSFTVRSFFFKAIFECDICLSFWTSWLLTSIYWVNHYGLGLNSIFVIIGTWFLSVGYAVIISFIIVPKYTE